MYSLALLAQRCKLSHNTPKPCRKRADCSKIQHKIGHRNLSMNHERQKICIHHTLPHQPKAAVTDRHAKELCGIFLIPLCHAVHILFIKLCKPDCHLVQPNVLCTAQIIGSAVNIIQLLLVAKALCAILTDPLDNTLIQKKSCARSHSQKQNDSYI